MSVHDRPSPIGVTSRRANPWLVLAVILVAEVMDLMDGTIVNVAAPSMRSDLHASLTSLQWIVGGYALAISVGLISASRLGDVLGRRRMFLIGATGFVVASAACGLAVAPGMLIATRLLQGLFAAALLPQGLGLIRDVFPESDLTKAFGVFGPVLGLAAVVGPIVGGALVDGDLLGLGWRAVFLVNIPIGAAAVIGGLRVLPDTRSPARPRLDLVGAALVSLASVLVILPLIQGREAGWPTWTFVSMAAGVGLFALFGAYEILRAAAGADPLLPPGLLSTRAFGGGLLVATGFFVSMTGVMLTWSLHLQLGLHFSPLRSGSSLASLSFGMALGAAASGAYLAPRFGRRVLHGGLLTMLAGTILLSFVVRDAGSDLTIWQLVAPGLILGIGIGLVIAPLFDTILAGVDGREVGAASGVLNAVQQLTGTIGVATLGTVYFSALGQHSSATAFAQTLWIAGGVMAVSFVLTFLLPRVVEGVPAEAALVGQR